MVPLGPTNSSVVSDNFPGSGAEGPIARTMTLFAWVLLTMKPPMRTFSPVPTRRRVAMLPSLPAMVPTTARLTGPVLRLNARDRGDGVAVRQSSATEGDREGTVSGYRYRVTTGGGRDREEVAARHVHSHRGDAFTRIVNVIPVRIAKDDAGEERSASVLRPEVLRDVKGIQVWPCPTSVPALMRIPASRKKVSVVVLRWPRPGTVTSVKRSL